MYIHAMYMHDVNCPSQLPWNDPTACIMAGWWSLRDALSWTGTVTPRSAVGNSPIIGNCSFTNYIPTLAAMVSPHSRSFTVVCSFANVKQHLIHKEIPSMSLCKKLTTNLLGGQGEASSAVLSNLPGSKRIVPQTFCSAIGSIHLVPNQLAEWLPQRVSLLQVCLQCHAWMPSWLLAAPKVSPLFAALLQCRSDLNQVSVPIRPLLQQLVWLSLASLVPRRP